MRLKALVEVSHAIPRGLEFESRDLGIDDTDAEVLVQLGHLARVVEPAKAEDPNPPPTTATTRAPARRAQTKALTTDTGRPGDPEAVKTDDPL